GRSPRGERGRAGRAALVTGAWGGGGGDTILTSRNGLRRLPAGTMALGGGVRGGRLARPAVTPSLRPCAADASPTRLGPGIHAPSRGGRARRGDSSPGDDTPGTMYLTPPVQRG